MNTRRMTVQDVDRVYEIELKSFHTPWTREDFHREMTENACARYVVAEMDGQVVGYAGAWCVLEEGHITNIAVHPDFRGQGAGSAVTQALMEYCANLGVNYMTLEVRKGNTIAWKMYEKLGFIRLGVRKKYYEDNGEDAYLYVCDHLPDPDPDFSEEATNQEGGLR